MDFSEKLKEIRNKEGLSQEQLADKIGVSRQAVTKWETGKGLPDIENMVILAQIFKVTLDELVLQVTPEKAEDKPTVFTSETAYDIDCSKRFDINIGNVKDITVSTGTDEKLHIILKSDAIEDIGSCFKVKLDDRKNRLDAVCSYKDKISRYEAEENVSVVITLPAAFSDHCEISADAKFLNIKSLDIRRLEYDGSAENVFISETSGSIELTSKTNYDITVDKISGRLDVNQWRAKSIVHIAKENCPAVINKGRKCSLHFIKDGKLTDFNPGEESENVISVSGLGSEMIVDLI